MMGRVLGFSEALPPPPPFFLPNDGNGYSNVLQPPDNFQVSDDDFCLPQPEEQRSYRGTIALKVSKRKPKPTQKILDMEAELLTKARQERMEEVRFIP